TNNSSGLYSTETNSLNTSQREHIVSQSLIPAIFSIGATITNDIGKQHGRGESPKVTHFTLQSDKIFVHDS
ncbi:unnamed protein product, partial [Adineta ricciae]